MRLSPPTGGGLRAWEAVPAQGLPRRPSLRRFRRRPIQPQPSSWVQPLAWQQPWVWVGPWPWAPARWEANSERRVSLRTSVPQLTRLSHVHYSVPISSTYLLGYCSIVVRVTPALDSRSSVGPQQVSASGLSTKHPPPPSQHLRPCSLTAGVEPRPYVGVLRVRVFAHGELVELSPLSVVELGTERGMRPRCPTPRLGSRPTRGTDSVKAGPGRAPQHNTFKTAARAFRAQTNLTSLSQDLQEEPSARYVHRRHVRGRGAPRGR